MSFEGYLQILCENGHLYTADYDYAGDGYPDCSCKFNSKVCGAKPHWYNIVDDTNLDTHGIIPQFEWEKLVVTQQQKSRWDGVVLNDVTYSVPTEEQIKTIRYFEDENHLYIKVDNDDVLDASYFNAYIKLKQEEVV